ncbi:MAG: HDOD domain-containing protein [Candidatus Eiseniibacteriota bacterium]
MDKPKKFYKGPANVVYNIDDSACGTDEAVVEAIQGSIRNKLQQGTLQIPRLPQVAGRIMQLTQSGDDIDLAEASSVIRTDPALAARILGTANSAAFAGTGRVNAIDTAMMRLGIKSVCNIVFTESLQNKLFSSKNYRDLVEQSWCLSMGCAVACETLSAATGLEPESAFLIGLLHDTGTPTLISAVSEYERKNNGQALGLAIVEILNSQLHEEVGAHVLEKWAMPEALVQAAGAHHRYRSGPEATPSRQLIYAAGLLCTQLGIGTEQRDVTFNLERVFSDIGLTDSSQLESILESIDTDVRALFTEFGIKPPPPRPNLDEGRPAA